MVASTKEVERLRERVRLQDIELRIYRELGQSTVKAADLGVLMDKMMDYVLQAVETDSATLYRVDEGKKELIFEVVKGPLSAKFKGKRMKCDEGIAGLVSTSGKAFVSSDLAHEKKWSGGKGVKTHNMAAVPLKVKRKTIGVICVMDKAKGREFGKSDLKVLTSIANHFSIILERRGLFSELDTKLKQFSVLHDVGALLISTLDEKLVRERSIGAITELMDTETGSLLMVDSARKELYFDVALGEMGEKIKTVRLKVGEGIAGWVARHGRPLLIDDVTKDKRFQGGLDKKSTFKTRDMICVPVKVKDKTIGVVQAINKRGGRFTKADLELFQLFSNQVAIAIDNARLYKEIRETFYSTSETLADAIEKRDPYTGGHTKRVFEYSVAIGEELSMKHDELEELKLSAVLHDIGKIGVDDSILRKKGPLDDEERAKMSMHPEMGADILGHVRQLASVMPGILYHHERPDGKGYPKGLKGRKIPLMARIIAVADTYDAMTTTRPYRKGLPVNTAIEELDKYSGTQFDKEVVKAFIRAFDKGVIGAAGISST